MGGIMEASMLYNLLNQGTRPTYMFDPSNMLLLGIRKKFITTCRYPKSRKL